jgi:hypothetical protein
MGSGDFELAVGRRPASAEIVAAYRNILGAGSLHRRALLSVLIDSGQAVDEESISDVLARIQNLTRSVDGSMVAHVRDTTHHMVEGYESLSHATATPVLLAQRRQIDTILAGTNRTEQRRELFRAAGGTSGLLGYIAVGRGDFALARAFCAEAYALFDLTGAAELKCWARGLQSFCEYYAGDYPSALMFAEDGFAVGAGSPQSVRVVVNGVARARGKLGDVPGVHQAVDDAYNLMSRHDAPDGMPSSVTFGCYSAAQVAANAVTAYVAAGLPDRAREYADLALPVIGELGSPWSRSLVLIDLAIAQILSPDAELDGAATIVQEAISAAGSSVISVVRRTQDFLRLATEKGHTKNKCVETVRQTLQALEAR